MGRFYRKRIENTRSDNRYFIAVGNHGSSWEEVEVSKRLFDVIEELQREIWRLDRRESRHSNHSELFFDDDLPASFQVRGPEEILIQKLESKILYAALKQLPTAQQRRFLLHTLAEIPIKQIAFLEGCSPRAVKYSLALAKKNLQKILLDETSP